MKKAIICALILLTSGITAWSFNKKEDTKTTSEITVEKTHFITKPANKPLSDISTAD